MWVRHTPHPHRLRPKVIPVPSRRYNQPMRIASRRRATIFFSVSRRLAWRAGRWPLAAAGSSSTGATISKSFSGIIFFAAIIAGMILNTTFLVREIRRNEQHDSFINAVTHELKTPIASIRLYLQTLQRREVDEAQRREFYRLMLEDSDRLLHTVEQVLKAGEAGHKRGMPAHAAGFRSFGAGVRRNRAQPLSPATGSRRVIEQSAERSRAAVTRRSRRVAHRRFQRARQRHQVFAPMGWTFPCASRRRTKSTLVLSVQDHGVGIPAHELKRIFKRFYRVRGRAAEPRERHGPGSVHRPRHCPQARRPRFRRRAKVKAREPRW